MNFNILLNAIYSENDYEVPITNLLKEYYRIILKLNINKIQKINILQIILNKRKVDKFYHNNIFDDYYVLKTSETMQKIVLLAKKFRKYRKKDRDNIDKTGRAFKLNFYLRDLYQEMHSLIDIIKLKLDDIESRKLKSDASKRAIKIKCTGIFNYILKMKSSNSVENIKTRIDLSSKEDSILFGDYIIYKNNNKIIEILITDNNNKKINSRNSIEIKYRTFERYLYDYSYKKETVKKYENVFREPV